MYMIQHYFIKKPPPVLCLCYKPRGEDASARLAQQGGMDLSHLVELGLVLHGRAGSTPELEALQWLGLLWLSLGHAQKPLLRASSPVSPELGNEPQIW